MDLSDVSEEIAYELLPPGRYPAEIVEVEFGDSQSSGKPMLTWHFECEGVSTEGKEVVRTLRYYTVLEGNGLSRLKKMVNRLLEENEPFDWSHFDANEMAEWGIGRQATALVRVGRDRVDPSIKRNNISDIFPPEGEEFAVE